MQSAERSRAKRALQATTSTWCRVDTRKSDERLQRTVDVCGKVYQQVALIASRRNSVIKQWEYSPYKLYRFQKARSNP